MQSVSQAANVSSRFLPETLLSASNSESNDPQKFNISNEHPIYLLWSTTSTGFNETLQTLLLNSSQLFYSLLQGNNGQLSVEEDRAASGNLYDQYLNNGGPPSLLLPSGDTSSSSLAAKVTSTTLQLASGSILQNGISGGNASLAESEARQRELEELLGQVRDSLPTVVLMTVVYALILIIGVSGNALTCLVIAKQRYMHTATNFYLFSLAVSDFLFLILGIPNEIVLLWQR